MKHNKVSSPKGKKQKVKGPGKKMRNLKHKELNAKNKVLGGSGTKMTHKGKTVYQAKSSKGY